MKKAFFVCMLLSSTVIFSQAGMGKRGRNQPIKRAPAKVLQSFQKENPDVKDTHWSENNHEWQANYIDNKHHTVDAYYDRNGIRKDMHCALDKMDVPRNINRSITSMYGGNYRVARIERLNEAPVYQIKVHNGEKSRTVYMDEQANKKQYNDQH